MGWFRSHRRPGTWLALLALALQLVLSFGHIHVAAAGSATINAIAVDAAGPSAPAPDNDRHDDYCAICAVLSLLNGAQIAAPPAIAPLLPFVSTAFAVIEEAARVVTSRAAFHSRAPPNS